MICLASISHVASDLPSNQRHHLAVPRGRGIVQIADIDRQQIHRRVAAPEPGSKASRPRKCRSRSRAAPYRARRSSAAGDSRDRCSRTRIRPDRSIFRSRRTRQTCCSLTSRRGPPETARSDAQILPKEPVPAGTILPALDQAEACPLSRPNPRAQIGPRHVLTVCGIFLSVRAIERVECPSPAIKTIGARKASRCSVLGARNRASSAARSSGVGRTPAALGIIPMSIMNALPQKGY